MTTAQKKFGLLLTGDFSAFLGYLLWFAVPRYGSVFLLAGLVISTLAGTAGRKVEAELTDPQRRWRAKVVTAGYLFFVSVLVLLACLFRTAAAWCFAAVGATVLLCCTYFARRQIMAGRAGTVDQGSGG